MSALPFVAVSQLIALVAGLALGFFLWRKGTSSVRIESGRVTAELARTESQAKELSRAAARLRSEQRTMSNLTRFLPNLVRDLNRSDLDRRQIPSLLFQLVETIFEPEQILLFLARDSADESAPVKELYLCEHRGLAEVPAGAGRIEVGKGKIGWVAENRVEMLLDDWLNLTRTEGRSIPDDNSSFRLDMIGPLLHHDQGEDHVLGVLCVGGPMSRPRDEKLMLQMVTNLGSIAIMNTRNVGRLREQANHDGMTGLLNKRHFMQRLGILIHEAERDGKPLGVFIFDIDHFKHYNDNNGHMEGDEVLRGVARVLRDNLRPQDIPCRYGGEEFIVAMPGTGGDVAVQVAERIRKAVCSHPFAHAKRQPGGKLTISGGVSIFPNDGTNSVDLIRHADEALYQAKAAGRDDVRAHRGVSIGDERAAEAEDPAWMLDPSSVTEI